MSRKRSQPKGPAPSHLRPVRCDDPSTWQRARTLSVEELLRTVEQHGIASGLDLHGSRLDSLDLSPDGLRRHVDAYKKRHGSDAEIPWVSFWGGIRLMDAHLEFSSAGRAKLEGCDLRGARMQGVQLTWSDLRQANFRRANLVGAELAVSDCRGASFIGSDLSRAELTGADLRGADFRESNLEEANLLAAGLGRALWYGVRLRRTRMRREQLGEVIGDELLAKGLRRAPLVMTPNTMPYFDQANEAYLVLKNNFEELGRYEDAAWAYYRERLMDKAMQFPASEGHRQIRMKLLAVGRRVARRLPRSVRRVFGRHIVLPLVSLALHIRLFFRPYPSFTDEEERRERFDRPRWLRAWIYELLAGYGQRPLRPLFWAATLAALIFPLVYWAIGALPGHGRAFTSTSPSNIDWAGWGESIIFSLTSFGTLSFTRLQPDGTLPNVVAACEAFTGVLLFALFIFTLGNRMSRS